MTPSDFRLQFFVMALTAETIILEPKALGISGRVMTKIHDFD
eukprot:CAMPEP_0204523720 /NCGR_PEP_ID=MMETSP0661-20131031/6992_1 /ASSEMBLY_ACC=CAM_ASM_000606 /TAXON_ID=109239 /ORGANISM="Alexandrium margalefi, Strain AMGDE01CS-322" /LENGTH=41 /DNA_ID= /DNA_START= /DNA_END= /DNA_ORIENTATION=